MRTLFFLIVVSLISILAQGKESPAQGIPQEVQDYIIKDALQVFFDAGTGIHVMNNDAGRAFFTTTGDVYFGTPTTKLEDIVNKQTTNGSIIHVKAHTINPTSVDIFENTLCYVGETITECFINNSTGISQFFTVYTAKEDLKLTMSSDLPIETGPDNNLVFSNGNHTLTVSTLKAWDTNNKPLTARFDISGTEMNIIVNTKGAQFPIFIDPDWHMHEPECYQHDLWGKAVSIGDLNNDGYSDFVVSNPHWSTGGYQNVGRIYVYMSKYATGDYPGYPYPPYALDSPVQQDDLNFGFSLSSIKNTNGDSYNDIAVGAPGYSSNKGRVYVYFGSSTGIKNSSKLAVDPSVNGGQFGYTVDLARKLNNDSYADLAVGSPYWDYDISNLDRGRIDVFYGSTSGPSTQWSYLGTTNTNKVGWAVADVDYLCDTTYSALVVGNPYNDPSAYEDAGNLWVFRGTSTGLPSSPTATIAAASVQAGAHFGWSVAYAGKITGAGDSYGDIVAGSPDYDFTRNLVTYTDGGSASIIYGTSTCSSGFSKATDILPSVRGAYPFDQNGARFGYAVAGGADIFTDGYPDVVIGIPYYHSATNDRGAFIGYKGGSGGISTDGWHSLTTTNTQYHSRSGYSLRCNRHAATEAYDMCVVGANSTGGNEVGDVKYVFTVYGNNEDDLWAMSWTNPCSHTPYLDPGTAENDSFGISMSNMTIGTSGYLAVGAPNYNTTDRIVGKVYIFEYNQTTGLKPYIKYSKTGEACSQFGAQVNLGNYDNDSYIDLVVSAPGTTWNDCTNGTDIEKVYSWRGVNGLLDDTPDWTVDKSGDGNNIVYGTTMSSGYVNGDSYMDILIGSAPRLSSSLVELYLGSSTGLNPTRTWYTNAVNQGKVLITKSVNGDAYGDWFIAQKHGSVDAVAYYWGSVNINGDKVPNGYIDDPDASNGTFGYTMAGMLDSDHDSKQEIAIGNITYGAAYGVPPAGKVYVYEWSGSAWSNIWSYTNSSSYKAVGTAMDHGDVNGDYGGSAGDDLILGSTYSWRDADANPLACEYVLAFYGSATGFPSSPSHAESSWASSHVAPFGSYYGWGKNLLVFDNDLDGYDDVIVNAPYDTSYGYAHGAFGSITRLIGSSTGLP